jgi:hypothetical protein
MKPRDNIENLLQYLWDKCLGYKGFGGVIMLGRDKVFRILWFSENFQI